jgi:hypothetical protein
MIERVGRSRRWSSQQEPAAIARAGVWGLVGVALAVLAHGSTDGRLPGPATLITCWAILTVAGLGGTHREWGLLPLVASLATTQTGLHAFFMWSATGRWTHGGSVGWLCCGGGAPVPAGPGVHVAGVGLDRVSIVQLLARLLAVVICAWWLRRGEALVWNAARTVARGVHTVLTEVLTRIGLTPLTPRWPARPRVGRGPDRSANRGVLLACATSRRGPPAVVHRTAS